MSSSKPAILLVDDSPADQDLIREGLAGSKFESQIDVVSDGEEAIAFLRKTGKYISALRPDLMILDLNLPRKDGRAVLVDFKSEPKLRTIPVVVFTTSRSRQDISRCYELGANCYVTKPGSLQDFLVAVKLIEQFWLGVAATPYQS
jgi:two-component system, chemotaxis family, response regulator Rcp1